MSITLSEDAALRLAEAALRADHDAVLDELARAGMPPFLIELARHRYPSATHREYTCEWTAG